MHFFGRRRLEAFAAETATVESKISEGNPNSLLDVGGGDGAITEHVGKAIPRLVVVEPNARSRAKGMRRRPNIEFLAGSAERLPCPDASFDRVISVFAFHHFRDQPASLAEMRRALADGGLLLLLEFRVDRQPGAFWRLFAGHTHFLQQDDLCRMVSAAGFRSVAAEETPEGYCVTARR